MPLNFDDLIPAAGATAPQAAPPPTGLNFDDLIPGNAPQQQAGVLGGAAAAQPSIGQMFVNDLYKIPTGIYAGLKSAFTLPHDVMSGEAVVPQSANMLGGENTQDIGRVNDLASLGIRPSVAGRPTITAPPTGAQLKQAAAGQYQQALKSDIALTPDTLRAFKNQLEADFYNDGITDVHAPATFKLLDRFANPPADAVSVTPQNLRSMQKAFGNIKNKNTDPTEQMVAGSVLNQLNKLMENIDQVPSAVESGTAEGAQQFSGLVKDANADYTAYKASQAFDQRGLNAEYRANASHSGMNFENNLRSQVASILSRPSLMRGMSDETVQALQDFNAGSRTENTLRALGNVLGGGGGIGMLASGAVSHAFGLPFELGPAVGFALKNFANRRAANEYSAIGDTIRANSPLAQSGVVSRRPAPAIGLLGRAGARGALLVNQPADQE